MENLVKSEFWNLWTKNSQEVSNDEMENAYENFVKQVKALNQPETDYQTAFRTLNLTRIEFQSLQAQILYEQGKKCA